MRLKTLSSTRDIRVVATDLDRTLTDAHLRIVPAARAQLRRLRADGLQVILLTGRTGPELARRASFMAELDAAVVESGACLLREGESRPLARGGRTIKELAVWLSDRDITHRVGSASISLAVKDRASLTRWPLLRELAVHVNRDRIDVTVKGCDKGTGLRHALRALGESPRACLVFGDATNDLPAFAQAGYRVAVGNAQPALKAAAHEVAPGYGGHAVSRFLRQRFAQGDPT